MIYNIGACGFLQINRLQWPLRVQSLWFVQRSNFAFSQRERVKAAGIKGKSSLLVFFYTMIVNNGENPLCHRHSMSRWPGIGLFKFGCLPSTFSLELVRILWLPARIPLARMHLFSLGRHSLHSNTSEEPGGHICFALQCFFVFNTHSILESKQHDLQLADGSAVKVQLQLELRQRAGDDFPVRHANELGQTDHEGGDVLRLQLRFLGALEVSGKGWTHDGAGKARRTTGLIFDASCFTSLTNRPAWGPPSGWPPPCPGPRSGCGAA